MPPSQSPRIPLLSPPREEQTAIATHRSGSLTRDSHRSTEDLASAGASSQVIDVGGASSGVGGNALGLEEGQGDSKADLEGRQVEDVDEHDDLVAISGEDTVLQDGGYRQVGGTEVRGDKKLDRAKLVRRVTINLLLIGCWFFFSTLMNLYNSWLFSRKRKNFSYPLFTTSMHMVVQFFLSSVFMFVCRRNRKIVPRRRNGKRARPSVHDYMTKVLPCALSTALDIGLSNLSLKTITLTFYTMCKSSNLAFVLLFAFLFGLEKLRLSLIGIIALITIGVIMMVAAETEFVLEGAVEVLTASAMGGLRWALMQMLLKRKAMGMSNPIATMFWLSPLMGLFMLCGSLAFESWRGMLNSPFFANAGSSMNTILLLLTPGLIVFLMNLCEFSLIQRTSVMTLSVAGIFKEIMTIFISSTVFGDELTPINVTGLCIAIVGIALYNYYKYRLMMRNAAEGGSISGGHGASEDDEDDGDIDDEEHAASRYTELDGGVVSRKDDRNVKSSKAQVQHALGHITRYDAVSEDDSLGESSGLAGKRTHVRDAEQEEDEALLTDGERERRRKREEEADMAGWNTSGFERTGNGWDDGRGYDSDATA